MKKLFNIIVSLFIIITSFNSCDREDQEPKNETNTGTIAFFIKKDFGCGNISVSINGITKQITGSFSNKIPECGENGTATFELAPGEYNFKANCGTYNWEGTLKILKGICQLRELTITDTPSSQNGKAIFWTKENMQCGNINVTINGQTQTINKYFSESPPCETTGCANFILPPGTYSYTASCQGRNWNGTVTITSNGCSKMQLVSNGGGNNGSQTGKVMFWTKTDHSCGPITVSIAGQTAIVSNYFTSGSPSGCGITGCANFSLPIGNYSFTATCGTYNWNGTVPITSDGCFLLQLD